jgi:hypothetical protein
MDESKVFVLMEKMQKQLIYLEKKIDILINQSGGKPSRERYSPRPPQSFGRPARPSRPGNFRNKREPQKSESEGYFRNKFGGKKSGFGSQKRSGPKRKSFAAKRKSQ